MVNKSAAVPTTTAYLYDLVAGLAVAATSSSTPKTIIGVSNQSISVADALTQVPVFDLFPQDVWLVGSTNNSNAAHNGQLMVLGANAYTVNNTGTTDTAGIVEQVGVYGDTTDKKILVKFVLP